MNQENKVRLAIAAYFVTQSVAIVLWWILLHLWPASIAWFHPSSWPSESLFAFRIADLVLLVLGSSLAAFAVAKSKPWDHVVVWSVAIATWYPTLYCLGVSCMTDLAWFATASMACMSGLSLVMATMIGNGSQGTAVIRATRMSKFESVAWTAIQIVIFWSVFLWILPKAIVEIQLRFGIEKFDHFAKEILATTFFLAASALGLWSAVTMSTKGSGTPLPTLTAPELVVSGPYRWVRNPMAVAGIAQGLAVGWAIGSWPVLIYSIFGAVVWHYLARPTEEADLSSRFGEQYDRYRKEVSLWSPRIRIKR